MQLCKQLMCDVPTCSFSFLTGRSTFRSCWYERSWCFVFVGSSCGVMIEPKALSGTGQVGSPVQRQPKQGLDAMQSLVLIHSCSLVACKLLRSATQTRSFSDYIYICVHRCFLSFIYIETNAELLYCTSLFLLFMDREREGMGASGSRRAAAAASSGPLAPAPEGAGELRHRQQEVRVRQEEVRRCMRREGGASPRAQGGGAPPRVPGISSIPPWRSRRLPAPPCRWGRLRGGGGGGGSPESAPSPSSKGAHRRGGGEEAKGLPPAWSLLLLTRAAPPTLDPPVVEAGDRR
jgi:hypothetical protein